VSDLSRYEILGELGRGAMGVVYRGRDRVSGLELAIKVLTRSACGSELQRKRLEREAEALVRLDHPYVVSLVGWGGHQGGIHLAMELASGGSLADRIKLGGALPIPEAARVTAQVARALEYVHAEGIVHRDVKPDNILYAEGDDVRLTDFGLALDVDSGQSRLSRTGFALGTPGYWSPEQARGAKAEIGPATDIYALGATLYEMLTGSVPFGGTNLVEAVAVVLHEEPTPPSKLRAGLDRELEAICLRCLRKDPHDRYRGAGELAQALETFLDPAVRARLARRRAGMLLASGLVACGLAALGGVLAATGEREAPPSSAPLTPTTPAGVPPGAQGVSQPSPASRGEASRAGAARVRELLEGASAASREGDPEGALELIDQALELEPTSLDAWNRRGLNLAALGEWARAIGSYERALAIDDRQGRAYHNRGWARFQLGDFEGAIADCTANLMWRAAQGRAVGRGSWMSFENRARARSVLGDHRGAALDFASAIRALPHEERRRASLLRGLIAASEEDADPETPLETDALRVLLQTTRPLERRRPREALRRYEQALGEHAEASALHLARARVLSALDDDAGAEQALLRATALSPQQAFAWKRLGKLRAYGLRNYQEGIVDLDRALELDDRDAFSWLYRGWSKAMLRRWDEALQDLDRGLALEPNAAGGRHDRGWVRRTLGDHQGAIEDLQLALALGPASDAAVDRCRRWLAESRAALERSR
jgi:tetratricopeptide (TPR) repeat protein